MSFASSGFPLPANNFTWESRSSNPDSISGASPPSFSWGVPAFAESAKASEPKRHSPVVPRATTVAARNVLPSAARPHFIFGNDPPARNPPLDDETVRTERRPCPRAPLTNAVLTPAAPPTARGTLATKRKNILGRRQFLLEPEQYRPMKIKEQVLRNVYNLLF